MISTEAVRWAIERLPRPELVPAAAWITTIELLEAAGLMTTILTDADGPYLVAQDHTALTAYYIAEPTIAEEHPLLYGLYLSSQSRSHNFSTDRFLKLQESAILTMGAALNVLGVVVQLISPVQATLVDDQRQVVGTIWPLGDQGLMVDAPIELQEAAIRAVKDTSTHPSEWQSDWMVLDVYFPSPAGHTPEVTAMLSPLPPDEIL